jgi:hypothetical protein
MEKNYEKVPSFRPVDPRQQRLLGETMIIHRTFDSSGYTVLERRPGELEIWCYWTDRLVHRIYGPHPWLEHIKSNWWGASEWCSAHDQLNLDGQVPERPWPSGYPDGERPKAWKGSR